jgi:hypothetical protein
MPLFFPNMFYFGKILTDPLIIINISKKMLKIIKITNRSLDHLATTTNTSTSRRRAAVVAPPSPMPGKACRSITCCSRQMRSRHAKALKDRRTRVATIADDENHRSEETGLKPHKQLRNPTKSQENPQTHDSTRPLPVLEKSSEQG